MSNMLDSPPVALAFDYGSFGMLAAANNLWTWITVISTAVLSFWRIRASVSSANSGRVSEESSSSSSSSCVDEIVNAEEEFKSIASTSSSSSFPSSPSSPTRFECDGGGATKGKFTAYYMEDQREDELAAAATTRTDEAESGGREWWWSWEREVRLRNGQRGWYKFQDLTAINGNVVRLWNES